MPRTLILIAVIVAVGGPVQAEEEGLALQVWKGKHRDELVAAWGEPQEVRRKKGGEIIIYKLMSGLVSHEYEVLLRPLCDPEGTVSLNRSWDEAAELKSQKIRFYVDSEGHVTKVKPKVFKLELLDSNVPGDGEPGPELAVKP